MARSTHPTYSAADRYERKMSRRNRSTVRRTATRRAALILALAEEA